MSNYKITKKNNYVYRCTTSIIMNGIHKIEFLKYEDFSQLKEYYKEGSLHRKGGPACIYKYSDGKYEKQHYKEGYWHRDDGPVVIIKNNDGSYEKEYYINGTEIEMPGNLSKKEIKIYLRSLVNI